MASSKERMGLVGVTATVTSKGQVTIPRAVRRVLAIEPGSRVIFVLEDGSARLVPVGGRSLSHLAGALAGDTEWPGMDAARAAYRTTLVEKYAAGSE